MAMRAQKTINCALLILAVALQSLSAAAQGFDQSCRSRGGTAIGKNCACITGSIFIDPRKETCPELTVKQVNETMGSFSPMQKCSAGGSATDCGIAATNLVERSHFCRNIARYLCDPEFNANVERSKEIQDHVEELTKKAMQSPQLQAFIHKNGSPQMKTCDELRSSNDYAICEWMLNEQVRTAILTPKRKEIAESTFENARKSLLAVLAKRSAQMQAEGKTVDKNKIDLMTNRVKSARLSFSASEPEYGYTFDAAADPTSGVVYADGSILEATMFPDSLRNTFMHELAHVADGASDGIQLVSGSIDSPFGQELFCLAQPDSVKMKKTDLACFEKDKKTFKDHGFIDSNSLLVNLEGYARTNFNLKDCQNSQYAETFADWLATEAYVDFHQTELQSTKEAGKKFDLSARLRAYPFLLEATSFYCSNAKQADLDPDKVEAYDGHPSDIDRINLIFFAHPNLRGALGCSEERDRNVQYCGKVEKQK